MAWPILSLAAESLVPCPTLSPWSARCAAYKVQGLVGLPVMLAVKELAMWP